MKQYSQQLLKVAATEDEHLVRKADLDRKVAVGIEIERRPGGRVNVRLLDETGAATGKIIRNVLLLPKRALFSIVSDDHHETWDTLSADEMLERAAIHNPFTEVDIV